MTEKCIVCGNRLEHACLTHCSEKCLFASIQQSRSIYNIPIERLIL